MATWRLWRLTHLSQRQSHSRSRQSSYPTSNQAIDRGIAPLISLLIKPFDCRPSFRGREHIVRYSGGILPIPQTKCKSDAQFEGKVLKEHSSRKRCSRKYIFCNESNDTKNNNYLPFIADNSVGVQASQNLHKRLSQTELSGFRARILDYIFA